MVSLIFSCILRFIRSDKISADADCVFGYNFYGESQEIISVSDIQRLVNGKLQMFLSIHYKCAEISPI